MLHKSSAWPLALLYAALIVYASLYPFAGWRDQGISRLGILVRVPWPKYWTGFRCGREPGRLWALGAWLP
jgi:hypothetical protein